MRNPYYPTIVTKFFLNPEVVDVIGFCTKNPRPMFPYLDEIKNFGQFWYISITGFDKDLEPNVPPIDQVIEDFKYLSNDIGSYNSCIHLCKYCYANGNEQTIRKNHSNHDDNSPLLIGHLSS